MLRKPRAFINGIACISCDVSTHRKQSADTFSATIPLTGNEGLASVTELKVAITGTNGEGSGATLLKGQADQITVDFAARTISLSGRDRTAELLDKTTSEKFQDKTSSEIVKEVAGRVGLQVQEDSTEGKAGKQYVEQHDKLTEGESLWSLIVGLAEREGKTAYVKGDTLYFKSPGFDEGSEGDYEISYTPPTPSSYARGDFIRLRCTRNLYLAKGAKIKVQSFDRRKKKVVKAEKGSGGEGAPNYTYNIPGLTQDEADAIADKKNIENTRHEMSVDVSGPGNVDCDPRMSLILSGTRTIFDRSYVIESVRHTFSFDGGYDMSISAKNSASAS